MANGNEAIGAAGEGVIRPTLCPTCGATVAAADFDAHLREAHRLVRFGDSFVSGDALLQRLAAGMVAEPPRPENWESLLAVCRQLHGRQGDQVLVELLRRSLELLAPERRERLNAALAPTFARQDPARNLPVLAGSGETPIRQLALAAFAELVGPMPATLLVSLRGLLLDRRLSESTQLAAAARAFLSLDPASPAAEELANALVSGLGKNRSIERLRRLETLVGKSPVVDALCQQFEDRLRMTCPRCGVELRRPKMIRHLWEAHRLLLVDRRTREPWSLIEEWLEPTTAGPVDERVARSRALARHLGPDDGPRLERMLVARGYGSPEARQGMLEAARRQHGSLCPSCGQLAPLPPEPEPWELSRRRGRLHARGYLVEVNERGWRTWLEVRTPTRIVYRGQEPGLHWTRRGALFLLVGPFVLLALLCAIGLLNFAVAPIYSVSALLLGAAIAYSAVELDMWKRPSVSRRVQAYAWFVLAPRLHANEFDSADAAFLAALARHSLDDGLANQREPILARLLRVTEQETRNRGADPAFLAALVRLRLMDTIQATDSDLTNSLAEELGGCFHGERTLAFADRLLDGWKGEWRTRGSLARLRVLLLERAFDAGFEVRDLQDAGLSAPALGTILGSDRPDELAAWRLLWSLRAVRPWEVCGPALTVFQIADDPTYEPLFSEVPDLLFLHRESTWPPLIDDDDEFVAPRIIVCCRGVMLQDALFAETPIPCRVVQRPPESELMLGQRRIRCPENIAPVANRLQGWFRYFFQNFRPSIAEAAGWAGKDRATHWRAWGAATCSDCRTMFLPRVGAIGVPLESARPASFPAGDLVTQLDS